LRFGDPGIGGAGRFGGVEQRWRGKNGDNKRSKEAAGERHGDPSAEADSWQG
jgi:hypothetical protein